MKKLLWGAVEDAAQKARQNWEQGSNGQATTPASAPQQPGKQYLRLPMESARKLRWFDKGDTTAIVKTHLREKREMAETLGALKKIIIRSGMTEAEIDAEVVAMLEDTETARESDEGVNAVLLAAAQAELESLQALTARMAEERTAMQDRLARAEAGGAAAKSKDSWNANFSLEEEDEGGAAGSGSGAQALDPTLVADLNRCVQTLESALAASAASARLTHAAEADLSAAEVSAALQAAMASGATATASGQGELPSGQSEEDGASPSASASSAATAALLAKLQRLEGERRSACEEQLELERQLSAALAMAEQAGSLKEMLSQAAEQRASLEQALHTAQAEAAAAREATKTAEDAVEMLRGEVKRLQHTAQGASAMGRLQDLCLQAEERAHSAERRASVADARCTRAENGLREANAAIKEREKSLTGAQAEIKSLQAKLAAAESQGGGGSGVAASNASHQEEVSKLEKQLRSIEAEARAAQKELAAAKAAVVGAEGRMQAAEAHEAQVMAELRVMDDVTAERDQLSAQVFALRERLNEMKSEKGTADHYKKLAHELQSGRACLEDELLVTGQLVTQLEGRLRAALERVDAAETAAQVAESRARDAEKQIGSEVEHRLSAACANRSLWPLPILSEVAKLEARLAALQNALSAAQSRMEADSQALQSEMRQRTELQHKTAHLEGALLRLEEAATERAQDAQQNLARLNAQLTDAQAEVAHLTAANEELAASVAEAKHQASRAHSAILLPPPSHTPPGGGGNGKWQVQNAVGGGSLYGVADTQQLAQLRQASSLDQEDFEGMSEGGEGGASESLQGSHSNQDLHQHSNTAQQQQQQQHPPLVRRTSSSLGSVSGIRSGTRKGHPQQQVLGGVDILYLKNVVLKFMEAVTAGRVAERDALLPAVATLLQATPQEFHTLQRVLQNTAPPSVQVLSALGIKLPGF